MPDEKKQTRRVSYTHINDIRHKRSGYKRTKWFDVTWRYITTMMYTELNEISARDVETK